MAAQFRLSPLAKTQIGDIVEFIAADNEDAAVRVRCAVGDLRRCREASRQAVIDQPRS